jgi:hypothetical protein
MQYEIRQMKPSEIFYPIGWASVEGWNPGLYDGQAFYDTDPNGFFVGLLERKVIGTISAIAYDNTYGFIGFYIVREEFRNESIGMRLARTAMNYLGDRNIGIDGVLNRIDNYKRIGFKFAYKSFRYEGINIEPKNINNNQFTPLDVISMDHLVVYDSLHFPVEREKFLTNWLKMPNIKFVSVVNNNRVIGYGVIRSCGKGHKIGPLFADSYDIADDIFNALIQISSAKIVYLDIPEPNTNALKLVKNYSMKPCFETARMYSKDIPDFRINNVYGITSFELG